MSVVSHPDIITNTVKGFDDKLQQRFHFSLISDKTLDSIRSFASVAISTILNQSLNLFSDIIMMYFFLYFLLINVNRTEAAILFYLPFKREKINLFGKELVSQTFSNSVGIPLIALAQGVLGYLAYLITGVEEPGFWGVLTGFCSILPVVGSGIIFVPIAAYLFLNGGTWQGFLYWAGALLLWAVQIT